jgi:putative membrane protein
MKAFPHYLLASFLVFGAACSSSSETTNANMASSSADGTRTAGPRTSTEVNAANPEGGNAAANGPGGTNVPGATVPIGASGSDATTDQTAFMATFATMDDPTFMLTAASSNMLEVRAGQMASQKARNPEVRKFAQMMVSHHMRATQDLKGVAMLMGVQMPTVMMPVHQAMSDQLMDKSGKNFDETYMDMMETAHKLDIAMFEAKSTSAQTPGVKDFAARTLPMLRSHHSMADALEKKVD